MKTWIILLLLLMIPLMAAPLPHGLVTNSTTTSTFYSIVVSNITFTDTSVSWVPATKTYTVNTTVSYTSYNPVQVNVTVVGTTVSNWTTAAISTTSTTSTAILLVQAESTYWIIYTILGVFVLGVVAMIWRSRTGNV